MKIKKIKFLKKMALVGFGVGLMSMASFTVAGVAMISNADDKMKTIDKNENFQEYEAAKKQGEMGNNLSAGGIYASGFVMGAGAVGFHVLNGAEVDAYCENAKRKSNKEMIIGE